MAEVAPGPIRVLTVDDSAVIRGFLARIIDAEPDMTVVATAMNGQMALNVLDRRPVDIVLLDIEMPVMDGLTALPRILEKAPDARVIMASSLTEKGAEVTVRALSLGAADYVTKPSARHAQGLGPVARQLVRKIRVLAGRGDPLQAAGAPSPAGETPAGPDAGSAVSTSPPASGSAGAPTASRSRAEGTPSLPATLLDRQAGIAPPRFAPSSEPARILGIASSTGGPNALAEFFRRLPADFRLPVVLVQHMPALFTAMLAERLGGVTGRPAVEGADGMPVEDGHIYVAPGDWHMTVERSANGPVLRLDQSPPQNFCRPAADPLFRSMAQVYGGAQVAVVLTGMGHDGLQGAEAVARAGGTVLAQDQATSVVWGMPRAVAVSGLAHRVLPLTELPHAVTERAGALR